MEASDRQPALSEPAIHTKSADAAAAKAPAASNGGGAFESILADFNKHLGNGLSIGRPSKDPSKAAAPQQRASTGSGHALTAKQAADMGGDGQKRRGLQQVHCNHNPSD